MFSRIVTMHLKPDHVVEFTKTAQEQVLPLLRKQEGFKDEIIFVSPDGREATAISLWDRKENAESYSQKGYPQVLQALTDLLEGSPQVKPCEVINSTFHKVASQATV
jgi:quinol monooxygenase YgiN